MKKKPRIAFCLFGLAGGKNQKYGGQKVDYKIGYDLYKKHILNKNNCDVFIHTWNTELKKELTTLYKPKKSLFEKQIIFDEPSAFLKLVSKRPYMKHGTYSRWYSTKKVIELKAAYEKEKKFRYDFVFITRFDLGFFTTVDFSQFDPDKFYTAHAGRYIMPDGSPVPNRLYYEYAKKHDMSKLQYRHLGYPYNNEGFSDFWWFAGSDIMDQFGTLYDHLDEYTKKVPVSNHVLAEYHLRQLQLLHKVTFAFYRFKDFALVRRKFFGAVY